jgi:hypothetical protein
MGMISDIEIVAKIICEDQGYIPEELEPGDLPCIDGELPNGDPGHYKWREYVSLARKILRILNA